MDLIGFLMNDFSDGISIFLLFWLILSALIFLLILNFMVGWAICCWLLLILCCFDCLRFLDCSFFALVFVFSLYC